MKSLVRCGLLIAVIAMFVELNRWAPDYWRTGEATPSVMVIEDMPTMG